MIEMASVDTALSLILQHGAARVMASEDVSVADSGGRRLAQPVRAAVSQPPADVSAMDGYAVRFSDAALGAKLAVTGESRAGEPFDGGIASGEAVRIFTGAYVPQGADHILIQEDAGRDGDTVTVTCEQRSPSSIRKAGLDFRVGDELVPAGHVMSPGAIALSAAGNAASVTVLRRPRIGVLATGDELVAPGSNLRAGQIVNSIQPAIIECIRRWGGAPLDLGVARDTIESVSEKIAAPVDVTVSIGGASVGEYDVVRNAFATEGFEPVFQKIAVKPGKPTWFSQRPSGLALGLPGNPAAALVTAQLFLKPLIAALLGQEEASQVHAEAISEVDIPAGGAREEYLRAQATRTADTGLSVRPWSDQDSSLLHPFLSANALIRRPRNAPPVAKGEPVEMVLMD